VIAVPTLFIIVTLAFFLIRVAPGGPFHLERAIPPQIMANLDRAFHLDESIWQQYVTYLGNLFRGDLGPSFVKLDFTVRQLILLGLPASIQLGLSALFLAIVFGISFGSLAAVYQNRAIDYLVTGTATFGITIPPLVVGPVLSLIVGVWLGWLPTGAWGEGAWSYKILPIITLSLPFIAIVARLTRGAMIEALRSDHVRTARAYGLPTRSIVVVHSLRGAVLPVVSYLGPAAAGLLTGSVVVEKVFGIPGIGRYFVDGALSRDYTLVMGTVIVIAVFTLLFNLIVDVLYAIVDPRVRYD
jgi:oligopeptide transport system permease protein